MMILASSTQNLLVPVTGPVTDLTPYPVSVALRSDLLDGEPATADYVAASWQAGQAALLIHAGDYPAGVYRCYVRVQAGAEDVRLFSSRVRVGDARTG